MRTLGGLRFLVTHELFVASGQPQASAHYRALAGLQYWLSWQLFAANPIAQHAYNLVLHGALAAALLLALEAFGTSRRLAAGIAVLFALHPATAMTVAYVGGRMEMLGWLFFLLGLAGAMAGGVAAIGAVLLLRSLVGVHALTKEGFGLRAFVETAAGIEVRLAQSFFAPVDLAMQLNLPELGAVAATLALLAAGGAFVGADRLTRDAP